MTEAASRPARARRPPVPYLLLIPSALFMLALFGWPLIQGVLASVQTPGGGYGWENVRRMTAEPHFWPAVRNTALLIVIVIPLQFALAIAMALLLRERPRLSGLYFYVWAVPLAISDLAAGLVWLAIFADQGYLNSALAGLGLSESGYEWLSYEHPGTMLAAVVVAELWRATSLVFIILVGGLSVIPKEYDEAAQVFGATLWQRVRHVTLPLLRPSIQVALILRTILAFQTFAVAQALAGRNFPLLIGETYEWYVNLQNPYAASAVAMIILGVSMFTATVYLRALRQPDVIRGAR
ncbi:carbohydrate ABC transporter permease [Actinomadura alba]|uniref:Sugar ABC transporter permease n=1 Tax=Actinomadura alba TaxID=406431 RepID=A0ABR7LTV9_9ACTN|nr:sugar ABC transporter permease [Actinomadura alba]MBC6468219.1 sugar ABC transporter permease [Actinomadura alba]